MRRKSVRLGIAWLLTIFLENLDGKRQLKQAWTGNRSDAWKTFFSTREFREWQPGIQGMHLACGVRRTTIVTIFWTKALFQNNTARSVDHFKKSEVVA